MQVTLFFAPLHHTEPVGVKCAAKSSLFTSSPPLSFSLAPHPGTGALALPNLPELASPKLGAEQERKRGSYCSHTLIWPAGWS